MNTIKTWKERIKPEYHSVDSFAIAGRDAEITELRERVAYLESYTESQKDAMRVTMDELATVREALKVAQHDLFVKRELLFGAETERDALQAKLSAIEKQEPVIATKTWFENGEFRTQNLTASDIYKDPVAPVQPVNELVEACGRYEAALMAAFPQGAHGEAFEQWNEARKVLAKRDAKAAQPLTKEQGQEPGICSSLEIAAELGRADRAEQVQTAQSKGLFIDLIAAEGPEFVAEMAAIGCEPAQGERDQWSYDDGYRNGFGDAARFKEETRAYKEAYFKLCEEVASVRALQPRPPIILQSNVQPAQGDEIDWKDQYQKQKRRAEMWIAKYEKDIGPLEKVYPIALLQSNAERVPLTNEQITAAFNKAMAMRPREASNAETNRLFARAIEAEITKGQQ